MLIHTVRHIITSFEIVVFVSSDDYPGEIKRPVKKRQYCSCPVPKRPTPFRVLTQAVVIPDQAQFHAMTFLQRTDGQILEDSTDWDLTTRGPPVSSRVLMHLKIQAVKYKRIIAAVNLLC